MILNPIIPIWLMTIISVLILIFIIYKKYKKPYIEIIIIILLFVANLRIMIPSNNATISSNDLDVLFVFDTTISMEADDYPNNQTRSEKAKEDCKHIVEKLNGARFSILTFDNKAKILMPYTRDTEITINTIDILSPIGEYYATGSTPNVAIDTMNEALKSSEDKDDRIRIVFFISDGEITDESKLKSFSKLKKHIDNGAVLG